MSGAIVYCYGSCPASTRCCVCHRLCLLEGKVAYVEKARGADALVFHMGNATMCVGSSQDTRFRSGSDNHKLPARMRSVDHELALHMPVSRWRHLPLIGSVDVAEKQGSSVSARLVNVWTLKNIVYMVTTIGNIRSVLRWRRRQSLPPHSELLLSTIRLLNLPPRMFHHSTSNTMAAAPSRALHTFFPDGSTIKQRTEQLSPC